MPRRTKPEPTAPTPITIQEVDWLNRGYIDLWSTVPHNGLPAFADIAKFMALVTKGVTPETAALTWGFDLKMAKRRPMFRAALRRAEAQAEATLVVAVGVAARTDWKCAAFLLERRFPVSARRPAGSGRGRPSTPRGPRRSPARPR